MNRRTAARVVASAALIATCLAGCGKPTPNLHSAAVSPSAIGQQPLTQQYESAGCGLIVHYPSDWKVNDFALSRGNQTTCSRLTAFPGSPAPSCGDEPLKRQRSLVEVYHGDRPIVANGTAADVYLYAIESDCSDVDAVVAAQIQLFKETGGEVTPIAGRVSSQASKCVETLSGADSGRASVRRRTCFLHVGVHVLGVTASSFDTDWPRESSTMFAIMDEMQLTPAIP